LLPLAKVTARGLGTLTPLQAHDLETLRVLLWWRRVVVASGIEGPDDIELALRDNPDLDLQFQKSGNLRRFARGGRPYRLSTGPELLKAIWPRRIQRTWPQHQTLSWLTTPFWYLMAGVPDTTMLIRCVQLLPEALQELLLDEAVTEGEGPKLKYLIKPVALDLAQGVSPMRLGALACARRRAHISGQAEIERLCVVASAWMLIEMRRRVTECERELFDHLLDYFLLDAAAHVYCIGYSAPIEAWEVEQLVGELADHANWSVEAELEHMKSAGHWTSAK
jgi:hypothetical protein